MTDNRPPEKRFYFTPRRVVMALIGVVGLIMMPFGITGLEISEWARRRRDG